MAEETDSDKKIAKLQREVLELQNTVRQLVRTARQSATEVTYLKSVTPKQMIRR